MLGACSRDTIRDAGRALLTLDFSEQLPKLDVPTMVVVGSADAHAAVRRARSPTSSPAPNWWSCRAGHMIMYERTDELDRLIASQRCLTMALPIPTAGERSP
jgi:pimeloyl-ACP methyl ester carboxylesterase